LSELRWRKADDLSHAGERDEAIAWFSFLLRQNPNDATAATRLLSLLSSHNFPVLRFPILVHDAPVLALDFSRTGNRLLTIAGTKARLWNLETGREEATLPHTAPLKVGLLVGATAERVLTISAEPKAHLWDLNRREVIRQFDLDPVDERSVGRQVLSTS